jgi:hypothetical protein
MCSPSAAEGCVREPTSSMWPARPVDVSASSSQPVLPSTISGIWPERTARPNVTAIGISRSTFGCRHVTSGVSESSALARRIALASPPPLAGTQTSGTRRRQVVRASIPTSSATPPRLASPCAALSPEPLPWLPCGSHRLPSSNRRLVLAAFTSTLSVPHAATESIWHHGAPTAKFFPDSVKTRKRVFRGKRAPFFPMSPYVNQPESGLSGVAPLASVALRGPKRVDTSGICYAHMLQPTDRAP